MVLRVCDLMRHGVTKMRKGVLSGPMEQQVLVDFEAVKAKVMIISFIIQLTNPYWYRQKTSDLCAFERSGFHKETIDMFECDENHSMDSRQFQIWIDRRAFLLREEHGNMIFNLLL